MPALIGSYGSSFGDGLKIRVPTASPELDFLRTVGVRYQRLLRGRTMKVAIRTYSRLHRTMIWRPPESIPQSSVNPGAGSAPSLPLRERLLDSAGWFGAFVLMIGVAGAFAARIPNEACGLAALPVMFFVFGAVPLLGVAVGKLTGRGWLGVVVTLSLVILILVMPAISSRFRESPDSEPPIEILDQRVNPWSAPPEDHHP